MLALTSGSPLFETACKKYCFGNTDPMITEWGGGNFTIHHSTATSYINVISRYDMIVLFLYLNAHTVCFQESVLLNATGKDVKRDLLDLMS